jgi:hypothetical protein
MHVLNIRCDREYSWEETKQSYVVRATTVGCSLAVARLSPWRVSRYARDSFFFLFFFFFGEKWYTHHDLPVKTTRTHGPLYSSSIRPSQHDSLLYTQFSRTHPSSISSSIHSIHYGTYLSLYLNISMCDLILKDLLRRI